MANKDYQNGFIAGLISKAKLEQKTDAYKSIAYNDDNSITLVDNDNEVHTMSYTYEGSKISQVFYDGEEIELDYSNDNITKVQNTNMSFGGITQSSGNLIRIMALETKAVTAGQVSDTNGAGSTCAVQGSNEWIYRSFLDYDLSSIPKGSKIISARLFLYTNNGNDYYTSGHTWLGKVTSSWDETIKWSTQPTFKGEYGQYTDRKQLRTTDMDTWIDFDATKLVQELVDNPDENYGITIINGNEYSYRVDWYFRNRRYEGYSTYLDIYYEEGGSNA